MDKGNDESERACAVVAVMGRPHGVFVLDYVSGCTSATSGTSAVRPHRNAFGLESEAGLNMPEFLIQLRH
jgi:hypothetical protein